MGPRCLYSPRCRERCGSQKQTAVPRSYGRYGRGALSYLANTPTNQRANSPPGSLRGLLKGEITHLLCSSSTFTSSGGTTALGLILAVLPNPTFGRPESSFRRMSPPLPRCDHLPGFSKAHQEKETRR